ncbi:MAG: phosphotransferase [Deltaproteobacteria bacterium]|nr:phosphotransferase [Deltaproteobacteria bacterium]
MSAAVVTKNSEREPLLEKFSQWLKRHPELQLQNFKCDWLPGDASNRFYGRLQFDGKKDPLILMVMNAPEAFKSEEVTGGKVSEPSELPFVTVAKEFAKGGIRVPKIVGVAENSEFILLEDFGDELLYQRRQENSALEWYELALKELAKIQKMKPFELAASRSFTKDLLLWETEHFLEYALIKRNKNLSEAVLKDFRNFFSKLVDDVVSSPYVITHRDYHSKNLLILEKEKQIGVIDFQDALMGPATYDLASLLRDSYVALDPTEEEHLISVFEKASGKKVDRRIYGLTSLQRNLKAAGRFYYISMVKGKDTHLPYVAPTLKRVLKTLRDLKELRILSLIEAHLQEEIQGSCKV